MYRWSEWKNTPGFDGLATCWYVGDVWLQLNVEAAPVLAHRPSAGWPEQGTVVVEDYATRYREGMDLVIRGVNARIRAREKVCHWCSWRLACHVV